jgi:capsular polysaccharide biosynthesis protein/Mrp family chromosome partitioning ATPase
VSAVFPLIRRWWWLLAVGTAAATFVGYLVASRVPPTYEAQTRLLVGPVSGGDKDTLQAAGGQARTYAEVATAAPILQRAASRIGLQRPGSFLKSKVTVTASDITRLIAIRAQDRNSQMAAAIANAVARELVAWSSRGLSPPQGKLAVVEFATPPSNPSGPSMLVILPLAAVAGLLGALGLAAIADSVMTVVRDEQDLAAVAPVNFLGAVNGRSSTRSNPLLVEARPTSDAAAAYRLLAAKIELSGHEGLPRSLLLLETRGGRSGSRLAANLAAVLTSAGRRVVLLEGGEKDDLATLFRVDGNTNQQKQFARRARPLRVGQVTLDRFRVRSSDFQVVRPRPRPEGLGANEAADTIDVLLDDAEVVILTASSSDRSPDSLAWSRVAQATVVVAESGHTKPEHIRAALEALRIVNANVIGTVLCRDSLF